MSRNATTGIYTRVSNSFSQPVTGTTIDPADADTFFDDVEESMNSFIGTSTTSLTIGTGTKAFTTQTTKTFIAGMFVQAISQANSANFMYGSVTSYDAGTGVLTLDVVTTGGSGTLADWLLLTAGARGGVGATGATGDFAGVLFNFSSTTTDSDPGAGNFRLNNATPASATAAYFDNTERGGTSISAWLDTFDDSGNSTLRGYLQIVDPATPATFYLYSVSGSVVDGTGYRKVTIAYIAGAGTLTNSNKTNITFFARGPAGSGDLTSTNNLSDVANASTARTNLGIVANPTGTIGLTAVNGSANTAIRSDGAPALSQAIVPTWTGVHTFAAGPGITFANASLGIKDTGGGSDAKQWDFLSGSGALAFRMANDAYSAANVYMTVNRTGYTVASIAFGGQVYAPLQTITDGANLTWTVNTGASGIGGQKAKVTLGGNRTMLAVVGAIEGASYYLWVIQDGTGTRTITWTTSGAGSFDFGTDGAPTLTTTASRADLLCFEAVTIAGTLKLRFAGIKKGFA